MMNAKRITPFFATANDLSGLLESVASTRPITLVAGGLFDCRVARAVSLSGELDPISNYLIADPQLPIQARLVHQRSGGEKFAIDQLENPKTAVLRPGGLVEDQKCLIAGQVGTASDDPISLELYSAVSGVIQRMYNKVQSYYLEAEAMVLFDSGVRLTANPKSPLEYDLSRD